MKYLATYITIALVMTIMDMLWLGVIAKPIYQESIGHLMAAEPNIPPIIIFYLLFPIGLMIFALIPHEHSIGWSKTLIAAALFGFFTYSTYDLTNLAVLKNWPVGISIIDVTWGTLISLTSAIAGKATMSRFTKR